MTEISDLKERMSAISENPKWANHAKITLLMVEISRKKREWIETLKIIIFWLFLLILLMVLEKLQGNKLDLITNISVQIAIIFILFYYFNKQFYQLYMIRVIQRGN